MSIHGQSRCRRSWWNNAAGDGWTRKPGRVTHEKRCPGQGSPKPARDTGYHRPPRPVISRSLAQPAETEITLSDHTCVTCPVYRPDAQPRLPHLPPVCDGDRRLLDSHLADLPDLHHRLDQPEPAEVDDRTYTLPHPRDRQVTLVYHREPAAPIGGAAPVPGQPRQPRVTMTRTPPAPMPLDPVDLTAPARHATRRMHARGALGLDDDQHGHLSTATILDTWVRDWRDCLWPDHRLPAPTVPVLAAWLRDRADDAAACHPHIDDFAAEIRQLHHILRHALGETDPQPETARFEGVTCRRCDLRGVLMQRPADDYVECGNCGLLLTQDEYADWVTQLADEHRTGWPSDTNCGQRGRNEAPHVPYNATAAGEGDAWSRQPATRR